MSERSKISAQLIHNAEAVRVAQTFDSETVVLTRSDITRLRKFLEKCEAYLESQRKGGRHVKTMSDFAKTFSRKGRAK